MKAESLTHLFTRFDNIVTLVYKILAEILPPANILKISKVKAIAQSSSLEKVDS